MKSSFGKVAAVLVLGLATPALAQETPAAQNTSPAPSVNTPAEGPSVASAPAASPAPAEGEDVPAEEAEEEEPAVTFSVEVPVASSYVWRGTLLSSELFKPALQPSLELGFNGVGPGAITVGGWLNQSLTEDDNAANREVDLYASYALPIGVVELELGYIVYLVPAFDPVDGQHEMSAVGTFDTGSAFSPYVGAHVDPIRLNGVYGQVGASYTIEAGSAEIAPELNVGVSKYEGIDFDLQDVTLAVRADVPFGESGLYGTATAAAALNGRAVEGDDKILPYGLLGVGFSN